MWYRHPIYAVIHVCIGCISSVFPWFGILALVYQVGQYVLNIRTFPIEMRIESGNSLAHTQSKLDEMYLGLLLGGIFQRYRQCYEPHFV